MCRLDWRVDFVDWPHVPQSQASIGRVSGDYVASVFASQLDYFDNAILVSIQATVRIERTVLVLHVPYAYLLGFNVIRWLNKSKRKSTCLILISTWGQIGHRKKTFQDTLEMGYLTLDAPADFFDFEPL